MAEDDVVSLADALHTLRITTPRLVLRLPVAQEWRVFAQAIVGRVVPAGSEHLVGEWAQLPSPDFDDAFVAERQRTLLSCTRDRWGIELGAFADRRLVGQASIYGREWTTKREVITASLVHPELRGRGLGTEMRAAVLALAFGTLGAEAAWSGASVDNAASNRVSHKLGYEFLGHQIKPTGGGEERFTRLRLAACAWTPDAAVRVAAGGESLRAALG